LPANRRQHAYAETRGKGPFPWRARWPVPGQRTANGRQFYDQAGGFATEDDALDYAEKQMVALRERTWFDPRKEATPLADWAAIWMNAQAHAKTTASRRRGLLRNHLLPAFGDTPIGEINRFGVRAWASRLTCAEVTREHCVSLLSSILTGAVEADMLRANPLYKMKLTKAGDQRAQSMQQEERVWAFPEQAVPIAARLWNIGKRTEALMVLVAAFVGLRYGEITGLHVDNCCLLRRDMLDGKPWTRYVIRVDPLRGALHDTTEEGGDRREHAVLYLGPPKPPNGAREADVPPFLAELLIARCAQVRARAKKLPDDHPAKGIVFTTPTGCLWRRSNWAKVLRPVCDGKPASPRRRGTAGHPAWEPLVEGLELHGLRHGHKTALQEDGINEVLQDEVMGHEQPRERRPIGKRYTHITPRMRRSRLDVLTARWEQAGGPALPWAA
jgi:integrase